MNTWRMGAVAGIRVVFATESVATPVKRFGDGLARQPRLESCDAMSIARWADIGFGSQANIRIAKSHVRFTPEADMCGATRDVC